MKTLRNIVLPIVIITACFSCEKMDNCISGDGNVINRIYSISDFDKVAVYGEADVYITNEQTTGMHIEGEENILKILDIDESNGKLSIGKDNCFRDIQTLKIYLSTSTLSEISISGLCKVYSPDKFATESFSATIEGDGSIDLRIDVSEYYASIEGMGTIVTQGNATNQILRISGDGTISCFDLEGEDADARIQGMGKIEVNVNSTLEVEIEGSGIVYYKGNPVVSENISGSGSVERVD